MGRPGTIELMRLLGIALEERLAPDGWILVDEGGRLGVTLEHPLDDDFTASVSLRRRRFSIPDRPPFEIATAVVGVIYEPLRRLWPLLSDRPAPVIAGRELTAGSEAAGRWAGTIGRVSDVAPAADAIADLVRGLRASRSASDSAIWTRGSHRGAALTIGPPRR